MVGALVLIKCVNIEDVVLMVRGVSYIVPPAGQCNDVM